MTGGKKRHLKTQELKTKLMWSSESSTEDRVPEIEHQSSHMWLLSSTIPARWKLEEKNYFLGDRGKYLCKEI